MVNLGNRFAYLRAIDLTASIYYTLLLVELQSPTLCPSNYVN